jgi:hypothetical protein
MESSRFQGYANPITRKFQFHLKQDTNSSCACAVVDDELPAELAARQSRPLALKVRFTDKRPDFAETITIYCDALDQSTVSTVVRGKVLAQKRSGQ